MSVRKAILAELFAVLLVLYGGFLGQILLESETGLWVMTLGLLIGLFAVVQGLSSDSIRSTRVSEAPDTDSDGIREWVVGVVLLFVVAFVGVAGAMVGGLLGISYPVGGTVGAIGGCIGVGWYYGQRASVRNS